jgi:hypothetical protein
MRQNVAKHEKTNGKNFLNIISAKPNETAVLRPILALS